MRHERRTMALSAAAIYAGAALLNLAEGVLPGGQDPSVLPGLVAVVAAGLLAVVGPRLPAAALFAFGPVGAALIAFAVATTHDYGDGAVLYMLPVVWTAYFFGQRGAAFIVVWTGVVHAVALVALPDGQASVDRWLDVEVGVIVVAGVVRFLAVRNDLLLDRLAAEARVDALTGLLNRRGFDERLRVEQAHAVREAAWLGTVRFDIDHFKRVNDEFGHEVGDRVLAWMGALIAAEVRGGDVAARVGGEEFVVILPRADPDATRGFAERVRAGVQVPRTPRVGVPPGLALTVSAGVSAAVAPVDAAALLRDADRALYAAKAAGRNRVVGAPLAP